METVETLKRKLSGMKTKTSSSQLSKTPANLKEETTYHKQKNKNNEKTTYHLFKKRNSADKKASPRESVILVTASPF